VTAAGKLLRWRVLPHRAYGSRVNVGRRVTLSASA